MKQPVIIYTNNKLCFLKTKKVEIKVRVCVCVCVCVGGFYFKGDPNKTCFCYNFC